MIKRSCVSDSTALAEMASHLWKNSSREQLQAEFSRIAESDDAVCYLKYCGTVLIGFAQCGLRRDYVEGTSSSPVGYLEGIYIKEAYRNRGYAAELLDACEAWAQEKGCAEFASDCELDNTDSYLFHMAMGFSEVNRVICFTKPIDPSIKKGATT